MNEKKINNRLKSLDNSNSNKFLSSNSRISREELIFLIKKLNKFYSRNNHKPSSSYLNSIKANLKQKVESIRTNKKTNKNHTDKKNTYFDEISIYSQKKINHSNFDSEKSSQDNIC